jgi:hypothetical protein
MTATQCAYCGKPVTRRDKDKEHVFPNCLYPPSKPKSKVQRLRIPSCRNCNKGWADDEAHFRNILVVAGEPNAARRELWQRKVLRSFDEIDGLRRRHDVVNRMKPVNSNTGVWYKVYPGEDARVIRVVKKVIKGLCFHHKVLSPVSDKRIWADILKYAVVPEFVYQMSHHHREQDIVEYRYQVLNEYGIHSAWLMTFFEKVSFIGLVSISKDGFQQ